MNRFSRWCYRDKHRCLEWTGEQLENRCECLHYLRFSIRSRLHVWVCAIRSSNRRTQKMLLAKRYSIYTIFKAIRARMATPNEISNNEHNHFAWRTALPNAVFPDKVINFQTRVRNLKKRWQQLHANCRRLSRAQREPMHQWTNKKWMHRAQPSGRSPDST